MFSLSYIAVCAYSKEKLVAAADYFAPEISLNSEPFRLSHLGSYSFQFITETTAVAKIQAPIYIQSFIIIYKTLGVSFILRQCRIDIIPFFPSIYPRRI